MANADRSVKEELHRLVDLLPEADGVTMVNDLASRLWILRRIYEADADIDAGRGLSLEQVRQHFDEHLASLRAKAGTCVTA